MCGIFGILTPERIKRETLDTAAQSLRHRGPDDSGTTIIPIPSGGELGLAHTRLSIIDLSPLGQQPMRDPATGNWIVFNGEIYNFRELRAQLESAGASFNSHSDTEVILAAYRVWGEDSFQRLRGIFALALWDEQRQLLLLARDPLGIKPLYYFHSGDKFLFASEVRALLRTGLIPRQLDPHGLFSFLAFGSVYEPRTIIEGISAVPPGHIVSVVPPVSPDGGHLEARRFSPPLTASIANSAGHDSAGQSSETAVQALPDLLRNAVLSHLVSDVPVGVFLSGGIDSSSLVAVMSQAGIRATTFSLIFREEEFNEAAYSRIVADRFATDHHEIMVSEQSALASLPEALSAMDQPTIDGINTWLISSKAHDERIKVALCGLGADEMFAGYSNFRRVPRMEKAAARFAKMPSALRKPVAASIALLAKNSDRTRKLSALADRELSHPYFLARTLFTPDERKALFAADAVLAERELADLERGALAACASLDPMNRVSWLETTCYMRNTLLRDSDSMSMAHGLEMRVPFLDEALVRACFSIPGKLKLEGGSPKGLLLRGLGVELPREIVDRPKRGFTLPWERWMRADLKPLIEQTLQSQAEPLPLLSPRAVADVWDRFLAGQTSWSRPWALFVLQRWCEKNL
ncbi:MAG: asparagine synthase (glutamine-hydrolyzing) [Terriglobales bacterium]|jgi:asparagine synthase (glutamine-hydrolysing)